MKATKNKKEAAETKEVAVAQEKSVALPQNQAWGSEELGAGDFLVPKLLLMQGLSQLVTDGEAQQGQIVDSITNDVLGGITNIKTKECKVLDLIAFQSFKSWVEFVKDGDNWEYRATYPMTKENQSLLMEEVLAGETIRRDKCLNFYVLRPDQIESGEAFPYVISFRRTSMKAGKKLATIAAQLRALGNKPLAFKHFELSVIPLENDKGSFWGYDLKAGKTSTEKELTKAFEWYKTLQTVEVKIDDKDLVSDVPAKAPGEETDY
jgi:hypothetical protein